MGTEGEEDVVGPVAGDAGEAGAGSARDPMEGDAGECGWTGVGDPRWSAACETLGGESLGGVWRAVGGVGKPGGSVGERGSTWSVGGGGANAEGHGVGSGASEVGGEGIPGRFRCSWWEGLGSGAGGAAGTDGVVYGKIVSSKMTCRETMTRRESRSKHL